MAKDEGKSCSGGGGGGERTRVRFHRREWEEAILTACGSYDNCDFSGGFFDFLLNVSVSKHTEEEGQEEDKKEGRECRKQRSCEMERGCGSADSEE